MLATQGAAMGTPRSKAISKFQRELTVLSNQECKGLLTALCQFWVLGSGGWKRGARRLSHVPRPKYPKLTKGCKQTQIGIEV